MSVPSDNDRTFHVTDEEDARRVHEWLVLTLAQERATAETPK